MHRLQRISASSLAASKPLPDVFGLGKAFSAFFRRGQTALIAADPNNGKSAAILWACIRWADMGLRVLYMSADTDEFTTWKRATATVTGQPQSYVSSLPKSRVSAALSTLGGRLSFSFNTDPSYTDIQEEVIAFFELWGAYPDVIVIDNLMDVIGDNEDEYGGMRDHTKMFKRLARVTDSCVISTHHCNEEAPTGKERDQAPSHPPARAKITGKVSQKAELVLTLAYDDETGRLMIAVVKNRDGDKNKNGTLFITIRADFDRMQLYDLQHQKLGAVA